ncbi:MAG: hypothetical protein AAF224_10210 [Pseudomonadota bacterium]
MRLSIFGTAGAALNFGVRRFETIMRLAWLPITLLIITNMAFVFGALSIAAGRFITFADIFGRFSFAATAARAQQVFQAGLAAGSPKMLALGLAAFVLQFVLMASFMAPLVRLKGVGEHPSAGILRVDVGPDQLRYMGGQLASGVGVALLLAPVWLAFLFIGSQAEAALKALYVSFPDAESLHTVAVKSASDVLAARGEAWRIGGGVWYGVFAAAFLLGAVIFTAHIRAAGARLLVAVVFGFFIAGTLAGFGYVRGDGGLAASRPLALAILIYASVRAFPYAGVAVCRRSMAVRDALSVTRGWNLFRLVAVLGLFFAALLFVQFVLFGLAFPMAGQAVGALFRLSELYSRLFNGGAPAPWVLPFFQTVWAGVKIGAQYLWLFFFYGASAGLLGRLYREAAGVR